MPTPTRRRPRATTTVGARAALAAIALSAAALAAGGCTAADADGPMPPAPAATRSITPELTLLASQTVPGFGAGQGVFLDRGFVYLYGDRYDRTNGPGVVREYRFLDESHPRGPALEYTGREILLTSGAGDTLVDVAPHPTGLTRLDDRRVLLGDTVRQRGNIFVVDWDRALRQGTLDGAVLHMLNDDRAFNGTRPERLALPSGRTAVATSDYGDRANQIRFYDPDELTRAVRSSSPGVLLGEAWSGPFVQTLHWWEEAGLLVKVQNQIPGLRWRLTFVEPSLGAGDYRVFEPVDLDFPTDELEGFGVLPAGAAGGAVSEAGWRYCVLLSAMREDNVWIGRIALPERADRP